MYVHDNFHGISLGDSHGNSNGQSKDPIRNPIEIPKINARERNPMEISMNILMENIMGIHIFFHWNVVGVSGGTFHIIYVFLFVHVDVL